MNGRKAVVGLGMLCALLISAFAAQSAPATTKGTTAFTCGVGGSFDYATADTHCKTNLGAGNGTLGHRAITEKTNIIGSNETTGGSTEPTILKATIGGVATELVSTSASATGSMENILSGSEHVARGTISEIFYSGVTVAKPAGKGCQVSLDTHAGAKGGVGSMTTKELTATTAGQGMGLKITPTEPFSSLLATFWIEGCEAPLTGLNKTYKLEGSVVVTPEGTTAKFSHGAKEPKEGTTGQGTLVLNGTIPAGISGTLTVKGPSGAGLTTTTIET